MPFSECLDTFIKAYTPDVNTLKLKLQVIVTVYPTPR